MRVIGWVLIMLILSSSSTLAIAPITGEIIKDAQIYGKTQSRSALADFLLPWTAYEENASKLDQTTERAYLYTPYLLIATDAREKSLNKQSVQITDSERILTDYAGTLSFSVTLFSATPFFAKNAIAVLQQDHKVITAYQATIPPEAEKTTWNPNPPFFTTQCYFYFLEKDIIPNKALVLSIVTSNKQEHRFYFDISRIK
ncbi:MAG TPA: hypothetical protein VGL27_12670 [Negativicutes bacterium]